MKITVQIDTNSPESQQIIDYLRSFPKVVTFEDSILHEPQYDYTTKSPTTFAPPEHYITVEEFKVEAKKRAKIFLEKHGLHS